MAVFKTKFDNAEVRESLWSISEKSLRQGGRVAS